MSPIITPVENSYISKLRYVCCSEDFFLDQAYDRVGRTAVLLEKLIIFLFMISLFSGGRVFYLMIEKGDFSAQVTFTFILTLFLLLCGFMGAYRRDIFLTTLFFLFSVFSSAFFVGLFIFTSISWNMETLQKCQADKTCQTSSMETFLHISSQTLIVFSVLIFPIILSLAALFLSFSLRRKLILSRYIEEMIKNPFDLRGV